MSHVIKKYPQSKKRKIYHSPKKSASQVPLPVVKEHRKRGRKPLTNSSTTNITKNSSSVPTTTPHEAPKVKFSPFQALLIGENNKVLKSHAPPKQAAALFSKMRSTSRELNPRELFDVPHKKRRGRPRKTDQEQKYQKTKTDEKDLPKYDLRKHYISKRKSRRHYNLRETIEEKIVRKLHRRRVLRMATPCSVVLQDFMKNSPENIADLKKRKKKKSTTNKEQEYVTDCLHHMYLKKIEEVKRLPLRPDATMAEISKSHDGLFQDFKFPEVPKRFNVVDFDDSAELQEILYEFHPKRIRLGTNKSFDDFSDALKHAGYIKRSKPHVDVHRRRSPKKSPPDKIGVVFDRRLLAKIQVDGQRNGNGNGGVEGAFLVNKSKDNEIICGTNLGSLLLRNADGKEVLLGNLIKPISRGRPRLVASC